MEGRVFNPGYPPLTRHNREYQKRRAIAVGAVRSPSFFCDQIHISDCPGTSVVLQCKCKEHLELEEKNMEIKVGTKVQWSSQSGGCWKTKRGVCLGQIPSRVKPADIFGWLSDLKTSQLHLDPYYPSANDRYLVKVLIKQKKGIKQVYYGPRMSAVKEES
jgi:hypothetical protein